MTLELTEEERQMLLLALAHLAVERPGWDHALSEVAQRMDNVAPDGPELYGKFKELRRRVIVSC